MRYDFESSADLTGVSAIKDNAEKIKSDLGLSYYSDTIPMWIADMDFVVAPEIVEAIKRRADRAIFGYTGFSDSYYNSVISWFKRRHNMEFNSSDIVYSNGTVAAIRDIVRAFTDIGDGVIIQTPVYYPFINVPKECGREIVENPLISDSNNHYSIDFEDFEKRCKDPNNKLFILCNPHNPIGQIWSREDVSKLLEICKNNNVLFFSDEVHSDIVRSGKEFTSTLNISDGDNLIVATAVNKSFNLAGLHITNLLIPNNSLRDCFTKYRGMTLISPLSEAATIAAYSECDGWVDQMNSTLDDNLQYMKQFLSEHLPKVKFNTPDATYLTWLDFRGYNIPEHKILEIAAEEAHLILEGGSMFGAAGDGFLRVNIACPKSILIEALNRLKCAFANRY